MNEHRKSARAVIVSGLLLAALAGTALGQGGYYLNSVFPQPQSKPRDALSLELQNFPPEWNGSPLANDDFKPQSTAGYFPWS
jgi:hypothetical protein